MKKLIMFLMLLSVAVITFGQVTDPNQVTDLATWWEKYKWVSLLGLVYVIDMILDKTKLKEKLGTSLIGNMILKGFGLILTFLGKKTVQGYKAVRGIKVIIFALLLSGIGLTAGAQSKWDGFFKPVDKNLFSLKATEPGKATNVWMFRPTVSVTAMQFIPDKDKGFVVNTFSSAGTGISYNHYIDQNGEPYANYGFNALLLFNYDVSETTPVNLSFAGTVTAFQLVNLGVGYSPQLKKPFILTGLAITFNK
jgi:hypothetical protein